MIRQLQNWSQIPLFGSSHRCRNDHFGKCTLTRVFAGRLTQLAHSQHEVIWPFRQKNRLKMQKWASIRLPDRTRLSPFNGPHTFVTKHAWLSIDNGSRQAQRTPRLPFAIDVVLGQRVRDLPSPAMWFSPNAVISQYGLYIPRRPDQHLGRADFTPLRPRSNPSWRDI